MSVISNIEIEAIEAEDGGQIYSDQNNPEIHALDNEQINDILLVPLDTEVFFPYMHIGTILDKPDAVAGATKAYQSGEPAFFFLAPDTMPDDPTVVETDDILYSRGCVGRITQLQNLEGGKIGISAVMWHRAVAVDLKSRTPYLRADVLISPAPRAVKSEEEAGVGKRIMEAYGKMLEHLSPDDRKQLESLLSEIPDQSEKLLYCMMQNSPLSPEFRYMLLEAPDISSQRKKFADLLEEELAKMSVKAEIAHQAMAEMGQRQREEFLRVQMNKIKQELGESDDDEVEELKLRGASKIWNDATKARFDKEIRKLQRHNPATADYAVQYSYLDSYLDLPWDYCDNSNFTLQEVRTVLDRDHYGLDKVKERIVEQMAVLKLRGDTKAQILCLVGPPGVGKTSLGKSIAEALGRKYVRVALGGLHDEAEIRGHRRTYLGAMSGRILTALAKCGTSDPVMVLDEIDKIGADYKGDPSQALLEVLDPEQNCKFHDNYIDQDYDLSRVLFIATANSLSTISGPLLDRMEILEVSGYITEEKIEIAKRHLIPRCLESCGFEKSEISISNEGLKRIIEEYTRESGVRGLEKKINKILRKIACLKASGGDFKKVLDEKDVAALLGKPEAFNDMYEGNEIPGIVTGLAWTQVGGEILFIESSIAPGKEGKLAMTGNLGDVMKESAVLALQYIKANHGELGIPDNALEFGTVHVHVPEGAIPKDGPSAGITILTSLVSSFTGRRVRERLAMTGEITLRGRILPVGGIKEKILAAKRAGIDTVMLSSKNRKDVEEIQPVYLDGLQFHFVDSVEEALDFALLPAGD